MLHESLAEVLREIVYHHKDVMMTFTVRTPDGDEPFQMPVVKPLSVRQTQDGDYILTGYNLRRLPDDPKEAVTSRDIIRSYRVDRIVPHTLQFLTPALSPQAYEAPEVVSPPEPVEVSEETASGETPDDMDGSL